MNADTVARWILRATVCAAPILIFSMLFAHAHFDAVGIALGIGGFGTIPAVVVCWRMLGK